VNGVPLRDLVLVISATSSSATNLIFTINADSGSNYSSVEMTGDGSTGSSNGFTGSPSTIGRVDTIIGTTIVQLMDYSATDKHKTFLVRTNSTGQNIVRAIAGRWANTAAINSLNLTPVTVNWAIGSRFSLYGVA
jgi:hypothetical protein